MFSTFILGHQENLPKGTMKKSNTRSSRIVPFLIALAHGAFLTLPARAQEIPASPGLTIFPAGVVSSGTLQLDAGISYSNTVSGKKGLHIGRVMLRYGVGPVELQAEPGSQVVHWGAEEYHGFEDMRLGMKTTLFRSASGRAHISGQGTMRIPTGIAQLTAGDPELHLSTIADLMLGDLFFLSTRLDWHSPYFSGDESGTIMFFPGIAIPSISGGAGFGWARNIDNRSLEGSSTIFAGLFLGLGQATALELNAGRNLSTKDPLFYGVRIYRLLTR